jgi:hypothetical protein
VGDCKQLRGVEVRGLGHKASVNALSLLKVRRRVREGMIVSNQEESVVMAIVGLKAVVYENRDGKGRHGGEGRES